MSMRGNRPQERLALSLLFCWLVSICIVFWVVRWWQPSFFWTTLLFLYVIFGGYGCMTLAYERYKYFVLLSPIVRSHWRTLRREFKPMSLQADMLRTRAVGRGEIGDFQLDLRGLVDEVAVEIHADAIPGAPVSIPWSEIEYFRVTPRGDAGELRAHFRVRKAPNMPIVVPWLAEFARFAPMLA
ncbi:MAG: hypothetical protein KF911_07715 [Pseudomonadales bacterium]|nr:hypothetical protein [Pseudomonadales bacterium]